MNHKMIIKIVTTIVFVMIVTTIYYVKQNYHNSNVNNKGDDITNTMQTIKINIKINNEIFTATLIKNETVKKFIELLPITIKMHDHLSNEKFYDLGNSFPTALYSPGKIQSGDLMLFGTDTLVLFYENFTTSYHYTRLGRIDNPSKLKSALGQDDVIVTFELQSEI